MNIEAFITFEIDKYVSKEFLETHNIDLEDKAKIQKALTNELISFFEVLNIGIQCDFDNLYAIVGESLI